MRWRLISGYLTSLSGARLVYVQPNVVISEDDGRPAPGGNFSPLITTQYVARSGAKNAEPSSSEDCALVFRGI